MRHALVTVHLMDKARFANAPAAAERQLADAPPTPPAARPVSPATLVRRTRTQVVRPT